MAEDGGRGPQAGGEDAEISHVVNFVAGGLVSAVSKVAVYPMETKVLLMAIGGDAARDSRRLWHGVGVKGLENFLYNGVLWYLKELVRPPAPDPARPSDRPPASFAGAFAASLAAVVLAHPSSNVVVGMQASLKDAKARSALEVTKDLWRAHGPGGFFLGWRLSVALRVGSAMSLVVYEFVRARLAGVLGGDLSNFLAGLLGRLTEVYLSHPFKTLRSRQQAGQALMPSWSPAAFLGLFAGVGTAALADAVKIGIRFLLIERLRRLLQWTLDRSRARPSQRQTPKLQPVQELTRMSSAPSFCLALDAPSSAASEPECEVPLLEEDKAEGAQDDDGRPTLLGA